MKTTYNFIIIYLMGFLFALSMAIPNYINSTFLSEFVPEKIVGVFYTIASLLTLFVLIWLPKILKKFGNYKTTLVFLTLNTITLLILILSTNKWLVVTFFMINLVLITSILFNLDIFLERISSDHDTGKIRGMYLSVKNTAWVISPILAGFILTNGDYWKIYTIAGFLLLPVIFLLVKNLKNFKDSHYEETPFLKTYKIIRENKNIYKIFISNLLLGLFFSWMVIYTPVYLHQYLGFDWSIIGIMFTVMLLPFPILELPLGRLADEKYGEKEILILGFLILGIATISLSYITSVSPIVWAALLFITRIGASMIEVTTESYFFKKIDSDDTNILSFFRMTRPISYIIGPLLASLLLVFIDFKYLFVFLGIIVITLGISHAITLEDTK